MNNEITNTIEVLAEKVRVKEDEAAKLKKLVNELCLEAGLPVRYQTIQDSSKDSVSIRSDQFYGVPITTAIRGYLEIRKNTNQGPASVSAIFEALKNGGYKFETANDENAKVTIRNNLRKSSSIFHRLPNGDYGLLAWYPNAKPTKEVIVDEAHNGGKGKGRAPVERKIKNNVTHDEVKQVVSGIAGDFQSADVVKLVKERYPLREIKATTISTVLYLLTNKEGKLKIISERHGKKGAVYSKA